MQMSMQLYTLEATTTWSYGALLLYNNTFSCGVPYQWNIELIKIFPSNDLMPIFLGNHIGSICCNLNSFPRIVSFSSPNVGHNWKRNEPISLYNKVLLHHRHHSKPLDDVFHDFYLVEGEKHQKSFECRLGAWWKPCKSCGTTVASWGAEPRR